MRWKDEGTEEDPKAAADRPRLDEEEEAEDRHPHRPEDLRLE